MNLSHQLLPSSWLWAALGLYGAVLAAALWYAPWRRLFENEYSHVYFGSCVALLVIWALNAEAVEGVEYHFLGATLFTLMFGWSLAVIGIGVLIIGSVLNGAGTWLAVPLNGLIMGVIPVLISQALFYLVDRRLPNHFMTYVFLAAFLGGGLAMLSSIAGAATVLTLSGAMPFEKVAYAYLPYAPLMAFPEAFLTGVLVTAMVGLRPRWVSTFDDDRYLRGK